MLKIIKKIMLLSIFLLLLLCLIFFSGVLWPLKTFKPEKTQVPIFIPSVNIVDIEKEKLVAQQSVLIQDGRIIKLNPKTQSLPENTLVLDAENQYLMPALWDMHAHVIKLSPLLDMPLYIRYGVTNVRDMMSCPKKGDPFIACVDDFTRWTKEAESAIRIGPRIAGISSFQANGNAVHYYIPDAPAFYATENSEQAKQFVAHFKEQGVDAIKVYNNISREGYFALASEAKKQGLDLVGHRPRAVSAIEAAQHQKSIEHARFILHESFAGSEALRKKAEKGQWQEDRRAMLDQFDPQRAQAIFQAMREAQAWYVPTHLTRRIDAYADSARIRQDPNLRYVHPLMHWQMLEDINKTLAEAPTAEDRQTYIEFYEKGLALTGEAQRTGVKILAGSDYTYPGISLHMELQELVKAGLSPAQALRAATLSPAEYFNLESDYGSVSENKIADLILLNANPLENIEHTTDISAVIFNGNLYDKDTLEKMDNYVQGQASSWTVACKIIWAFLKSPVSY